LGGDDVTSAQALTLAEDFEEHRPFLFGVAYRMLGSAAEAEDIVQDAYLRCAAVQRDEIRNLRSYLVTVVTRLCLDHLKSARVQRERYVGQWLPEPVLTSDADWRLVPEGVIDLRESVSMAFLIMLERLSPVERAVLLLHDVFDYSHTEVAEIVEKSEPASRQVLKRARERVLEPRRRFTPSDEEHLRLTAQFLSAAETGSVETLRALLAEDAVAYADGGGKVASALNPIYGSARVARFVAAVPRKEETDRVDLLEVNGQLAALLWHAHRLHSVLTLDIVDGHIRQISSSATPTSTPYPPDPPPLPLSGVAPRHHARRTQGVSAPHRGRGLNHASHATHRSIATIAYESPGGGATLPDAQTGPDSGACFLFSARFRPGGRKRRAHPKRLP
jgi:RNA polymerase sigma-70 factor (ECF subfamily)